MARCESGARSPDAPTEPNCGTTGTIPALSIAANACKVCTRIPECPRKSVLTRMHSIARTTSAGNGSPTQTAWVTIRLRCNSTYSELPDFTAPGSSSRNGCAPSSLSALLPKPVDTP